jgi:hypothetical protein
MEIGNSSFERVKSPTFGNNLNKSKFYSGRNLEQVGFNECLLSFGAESFVYKLDIQKI